MRCRVLREGAPRLIPGEYWVKVLNCRDQWLDWVPLNAVPEGVEAVAKPAYLITSDFHANASCAVCPYVYVEADLGKLVQTGLFRVEYIGYDACPGSAIYVKSWSAGHGEGWGRLYAYVIARKVAVLEFPRPTNDEYALHALKALADAGFMSWVEVDGRVYVAAPVACTG